MSDFEEWLDHGRTELAPKMASSAVVMTVNPGDKPEDIDPKIALETGYAVLLGKPIIVLAPEGREINAGLRRIADKIVNLTGPLASVESQLAIQAGVEAMFKELGFKELGETE